MASRWIEIGLVLLLASSLCAGAAAQPSCTNAITILAPCLTYVTGNMSAPSSSCCSNLGSVVQASPQCLCSLLNGGASLGITINQTLALSLPGACKVQTLPINQCKTASAPKSSTNPVVGSPAPSPAASSDDTPAPAITPTSLGIPSATGSEAGSKTVPSTTNGTSTGSMIKAPLHFLLPLLFIASVASTVTKF